LIEKNELARAETLLRDSLEIDPANHTALTEMRYIDRLMRQPEVGREELTGIGEMAALVKKHELEARPPSDPHRSDITRISGLASTAHPHADPERLSALNAEYRKALAGWRDLPWWKKLLRRKPAPPPGILA
jgi:hypothetical protein